MGKQALVTTGATATFVGLIECALGVPFLEALVDLGYSKLVVQYGRSAQHINTVKNLCEQVTQCGSDGNISGKSLRARGREPAHMEVEDTEDRGCVIRTKFAGQLAIECLQYDASLTEHYTQESALVISHAGTGSIMDVLRLSSRGSNIQLVVMVNEKLQDNHQGEIADAFAGLGVLQSVRCSVEELVSAVSATSADSADTTNSAIRRSQLAPAQGAVVRRVVLEELNM